MVGPAKYPEYAEICRLILKESGPLLGSELLSRLVDRAKVSPNYGRQLVFLAKKNGDVLSSDPVRFKGDELVYFVKGQDLIPKLEKVSESRKPSLHRLYKAFVRLL